MGIIIIIAARSINLPELALQILNLHGGSGPRPDPATYTTHADKPCAADSACKCMTLCRPPPSPWPIAAARAVTTMMPFFVLPPPAGTRSRRS